ncbi:MAG: ABC transporter ATP-binding protein, partial [Phototrophicales bacterium]
CTDRGSMIHFHGITKTFGTFTVLDNLDLHIPKGKITFIVGKSGEGKSVTIKHIMGLLRPTKGWIEVDGENINDLDETDIRLYRRKFGMLFQHAALFDSLSVFDNVAFPLVEHGWKDKKAVRNRVGEVLQQVEIADTADKFPPALSTGEKKRVGLARALVAKPKILLYDEPTTGMDPLVSEMIDDLIVEVNLREADMTSVVISHDLKAAMATAEN